MTISYGSFNNLHESRVGMNYLDAGVDIEAGDAFVQTIAPLAKLTATAGVLGGVGGFGAMFDCKAVGFADPILVSSTDGVGTKLKVAIETGLHDTIGLDLVAMNVNDIIVHGATPLFFLDYFATGKLEASVATDVVRGIARGCSLAGCALVGGETAEMPGLYRHGDYDLAGFVVGAAERHRLLPAHVTAGDVLIGLPSSGIHANGFALVRHLVDGDTNGWGRPSWGWTFDGDRSFADVFLTPTRLYVSEVLSLARANQLHAAAHITGGGLVGNLPRVIPDNLTVKIDQPWTVPAEFGWLKRRGHLSNEEMLRTFNCGVGMVLVVPEHAASSVLASHDGAVPLGIVVAGDTPEITLPYDDWWL